jgi:nucleoside-diphosphate-sugar epimerase
VATSGRVSLNQLFRTIRDLVGGTVEPVYKEARAGDVRDSQADISKARRLLGYEPIVSFEQGLKATVEWFRASQTAVASQARDV